jgi:hypothetical protein
MPPRPARSLICWAIPPRLAQACTISTLQAWASKACQARDPHTHDLCSAGPRPPPGMSSRGPTDMQDLHSSACALQAHQARYFISAKGLHPQAGGTPPTWHPPSLPFFFSFIFFFFLHFFISFIFPSLSLFYPSFLVLLVLILLPS